MNELTPPPCANPRLVTTSSLSCGATSGYPGLSSSSSSSWGLVQTRHYLSAPRVVVYPIHLSGILTQNSRLQNSSHLLILASVRLTNSWTALCKFRLTTLPLAYLTLLFAIHLLHQILVRAGTLITTNLALQLPVARQATVPVSISLHWMVPLLLCNGVVCTGITC